MRSLLIALVIVILCSGCNPFVRYVPVPSPYPVIEVPNRPIVETEIPFTNRELTIANYARQLETVIKTYNTEAVLHNEKIPKVE